VELQQGCVLPISLFSQGCGEGTFAMELLLSNDTSALDKIPSVEGKEFKREK